MGEGGGIGTLGCAARVASGEPVADVGGRDTGGGVGDVAAEKILLSFWMAVCRASPGSWNGACGWGLARASAREEAARVASSAGEEVGQAQSCGKNTTVF